MNSDQIQSLIRTSLKMLGAYLATHGFMTDSLWQEIAGPLTALIGVLLSHYVHMDDTPVVPVPKSTPGVPPSDATKI